MFVILLLLCLCVCITLFNFLLFVHKKNNTNLLQSLCTFNTFEIKKRKVCKIPCHLINNHTFPNNRKWSCRSNKLYTINNTNILFNEDVKMVEFWIFNNTMNSNVKYFSV